MTPEEHEALIQRTAAALAGGAPVAAKEGLDRILAELDHAPDLARRLYAAMTGPLPKERMFMAMHGWFHSFAIAAREPSVVDHLHDDDWMARELVTVGVDAQHIADRLVAELANPKCSITGIAAAVLAGRRARDGLHALYEKGASPGWRPRMAVAIAVIGDPADAAWIKSLPSYDDYTNAKRIHAALTKKRVTVRVDAVDKIARSFASGTAEVSTLLGLCRLLESDAPEVVERAAQALLAQTRQPRKQNIHHAVFLRLARAAVLRGVTEPARAALDSVAATIFRAGPLPRGPIVTAGTAHANDDDLMRQIVANPHDDAPRLVLADRLLERGDLRGELIQIQCALGRGRDLRRAAALPPSLDTPLWWAWSDRAFYEHVPHPNVSELTNRETALIRKHWKEWLAPVRPFIDTWSWFRGLLYEVGGNAGRFLDGARTVLENHPIAGVWLHGFDKSSLERMRITPLPNLSRLRVDDVFEATPFLGENLARVRTFYWSRSLDDIGLGRLAHNSHLNAVERLLLPGNRVTDAGLRALAASPIFDNLEALYLERNPFTDAGLRALLETPQLPKLRKISLGDRSKLDPSTLTALRARFEVL